jgi:AcrR family transcriptional regulator
MPGQIKTEFSAVQNEEQARLLDIYYKAAKVFHQQGYEATSMSDIADALRMTKAGIYYYIKSKEELLFGIINHGLDWLEKEVVEPARALTDPEERLRWIIRNHGQGLLKGSKVIPLLTEEVSSLTPKHRQHVMNRKRRYFEFVRDTLEHLKAQRKLRPVDTTVGAFGLFGMILWLPRWYQPGGRMTAAETMDHLLNLYLSGVMEPRSTRSGSPRRKNLVQQRSNSTSSSHR